jgi:hypothetical protein
MSQTAGGLFVVCLLWATSAWPQAQVLSARPGAATVRHGAANTDAAGVALTAPVAPEVIARDDQGHVTVRASRLTEAVVVDGRLDDPAYRDVKPFGDFIQQEPHEGQPSTFRTDVWLLFDDRAIYVAARCWQDASLPLVANELRRDAQNMFENDNFAVIFDTFHDRRNGFMFQTNPLGSINDQLMTDEGAGSNRDWNTVWDLRTSRDDQGWSVEMRIPFASLRFPGQGAQTWGVNFRRNLQARTEYAYLTRIPASVGRRGLARVSLAATLVGLEIGTSSRNIELKPHVISSLITDRDAEPAVENDLDARVGVDAKFGIGQGLTGDLTVYTDFAQVEEDEAQVNLTRFSLFLPEKREFFLEGAGLFAFGGVPVGRAPGGGVQPIAPVLFFSRRIGLADEDPVQIVAGGRVTGRVGAWSLGALQIRQDESQTAGLPTTDFSVLRVRRDLFRRGSVGMIYTRRSPSEVTGATNQVGGIDLLLAPSQELTVNAYVARSDTPGLDDKDLSYRGRVEYASDRYGLQVEQLVVGTNFNPEAGLLRREDFQRSFAEGRFSRRPGGGSWLRKWNAIGSLDYIADNERVLESRSQQGSLRLDLANGDEASVTLERSYEALDEPLEITDDHLVPVGSYNFTIARAGYQLGPRHRVTGDLAVGAGSFYGGTIRELSYRGRVPITARVSLEPNLSWNRVTLPVDGTFWVNVAGLRFAWSLSPRSTFSTLVQYRSGTATLGASARLRWEYRPGSDLFVVYSEGYDTMLRGTPMMNRSVAVKMTRLFRF